MLDIASEVLQQTRGRWRFEHVSSLIVGIFLSIIHWCSTLLTTLKLRLQLVTDPHDTERLMTTHDGHDDYTLYCSIWDLCGNQRYGDSCNLRSHDQASAASASASKQLNQYHRCHLWLHTLRSETVGAVLADFLHMPGAYKLSCEVCVLFVKVVMWLRSLSVVSVAHLNGVNCRWHKEMFVSISVNEPSLDALS